MIPWAPNRGLAGWSLEDDILFLLLAQATSRYVGKNFQDNRVRKKNEPHPLFILAAGVFLKQFVPYKIVAYGEHFVDFSHKNMTCNMFVKKNELYFFFLLTNIIFMLEPSLS